MFKSKNVCLIISVALAILCLIFMIYSFCNASTGVNSADSTESVGTAIGMALVGSWWRRNHSAYCWWLCL